MNILFVAAEVAPFVSVGGLSQFTFFLPKALRNQGHDVRVFTARYGAMDENVIKNKWKFESVFPNLPVPQHDSLEKIIPCSVSSITDKKNKSITYFLENREYYELRANVYWYKDDYLRFALLSKGCLEWLYQIRETTDWWPDVIHCNDWHTGYVIEFARRNPRYSQVFRKTPIVFTVHNFGNQGNYDFRYAPKEEYDYGITPLYPLLSPKLKTQNLLKRGLLLADSINTVSPTHAVEVLTPEYAEGLEDVLQEVRGRLTGILNGLDTKRFNPKTDKLIKRQYDIKSFVRAREENKKDLQALFGLPKDVRRPLLAFSGRLFRQKGIDLILEVMPRLFQERPDVQLVALGSGADERYRLEFAVLQKKFPDQVGLHLRPDFRIPRKIFAGADMFLAPSLFEPGGIVALEALRYGCVPLARRTGGLNDVVKDFNPVTKKGNGFSFRSKDPWAFFGMLIEALTIYKYPRLWRSLVKNCLSCDFSWEHAAREYDVWYQQIKKNYREPVVLRQHQDAFILKKPLSIKPVWEKSSRSAS